MRVAVLDDYHEKAAELADWGSLDAEVVFFHQTITPEQLPAVLADFEVLVLMRERTAFSAQTLAQLPKLSLVVTTGMRNAALDVDYLNAHGVTVCGTGMLGYYPGQLNSTVEVAWALIFALYKRITDEDRAIRAGIWQQRQPFPRNLAGQTLGLIGLGRLGQQMIAPAKAFGLEVIAWSQNLTSERAAKVGAVRVELPQLLASADIVSIHVILSRRTHHLLGAAELAQMKHGAVLINTSRGPIVDESALVAGLRAGQPAAAGLDVYDQEPLPPEHPLLGLENTVLTPHLGYVSEAAFREMYEQVVEDISAYLQGTPIRAIN
jgi:phosphoglycerate dehydrogenase-like enzyme